MITPVTAVIQGFRKYAVFAGRATRAEFWWFVLFLSIGGIVFSIIDTIIGSAEGLRQGPFYNLFFLATLLPSVAITARRLHDIGKTGWWQVGWYVIPVISWLAALIMFIIAVAVTYGATDASGKWSLDADDILWESAGDAFAFAPAAIMVLAALLITVAVIVWAIIWLARPSESGQNRFGPDPRP